MDVREKLVELLKSAKTQELCDFLFSDIDTAIDMQGGDEYLANYLIANGVTVQEWISVKDPPKADGRYLVRNEYGMIYDLDYKSLYRGFGEKNEFEDGTDYFMQDLGVTHWMPLPEPPK